MTETINLNDNMVANADALIDVLPWNPIYDGLVIEIGHRREVYH